MCGGGRSTDVDSQCGVDELDRWISTEGFK